MVMISIYGCRYEAFTTILDRHQLRDVGIFCSTLWAGGSPTITLVATVTKNTVSSASGIREMPEVKVSARVAFGFDCEGHVLAIVTGQVDPIRFICHTILIFLNLHFPLQGFKKSH